MYECFGSTADDPWSGEYVRSFLDTHPVLEAIADYLTVDNLQTLLVNWRKPRSSIVGARRLTRRRALVIPGPSH